MVHEYGEETAYVLIEKLKNSYMDELENTAKVMKELLDGLAQ